MSVQIEKLIAESILGWKYEYVKVEGRYMDDYELFRKHDSRGIYVNNFNPTSDIQDAWLIVQAMENKGFIFLLESNLGNGVLNGMVATFFDYKRDGRTYTVTSKNAQFAICFAALKAVGIEVELNV